MVYPEVLIPVPIQGAFTYCAPEEMGLQIGSRVIVPFGKKKFYTGIVKGFATQCPKDYQPKEVLELLDVTPIVRKPQLQFWEWMSHYYLCTPGEVFRAAIPTGLKIESENFLSASPDWEEDSEDRLNPSELQVMDLLISNSKPLTSTQIAKKTGLKSPQRVISQLMQRGAVVLSEQLVSKYRTRTETCYNITAEDIHQAFDMVSRAPQQEKALIAMMDFVAKGISQVPRPLLQEKSQASLPALNALVQKKILAVTKREVNKFTYKGLVTGKLPTLTPAQTKALIETRQQWNDHEVALLHGVTSSGKTELYIHLIDQVLKQHQQVLYLVPEIALTTQLTQRLQRVFGSKVIIYHSRFSDNDRVDIYRKMLSHPEPAVIIGARSSLFLPFSALGLVIVDEEHESSYKQQDPSPRYNARDAAIMLAHMHGAKTLLGSATPSIETYFKATKGKYGLVSLTERFQQLPLPKFQLINMLDEKKRGRVHGAFSQSLVDMSNQSLDDGKQAILFLNRRGFAPMALCKQCGYVPKCVNCDVSLTYHKAIDKLVCHYCGTPYQLPQICPACKEPGLEVVGYGTERIEDEVKELFPRARIARLDLDTTRNKDSYENIIDSFSHGNTNLLVGTQMVSKGLDFDNVAVVGIVNADAVINYPDFRANERAFNMIEQVAGRAGRKNEQGLVAVQTRSPSHPLFSFITNHDYKGFYDYEIQQRKNFYYPPFARVIYIYLKHRDREALVAASREYYNRLSALLGNRISQPEEPTVARVQSLFIRRIMVKIETNVSIPHVKQLLESVRIELVNSHTLSGVQLYYDVDPY